MNPYLNVLLLSMAPISELRGAIPVGVTVLELPFWEVFVVSIIGNLIPVMIILLFLKPVVNFLSSNFGICDKFFSWLFSRTRKKTEKWILKYEEIALVLLVAIPLPVTGGWTGSIAAFLFNIPFRIAFPLISLGVLIAGGIVSGLTLAGVAVEKYFGWQTLLVIILVAITIWVGYSLKKRGENKS